MSVFKAIILGLVQGLTEFLPISSSGHLSVFNFFMGTSGEDSLLFTVLLHIGTLSAVIICYRKFIYELILEAVSIVRDIIHREFSFKDMNPMRRMLLFFIVSCIPLLFLMFPAGGGDKVMDKLSVFSEDKSILAEGFCFLFTGALLVVSSFLSEKGRLPRRKMNLPSAFAVGVAQMLAAAFPGISRSGSTISSGILCGIPKNYMVRYSFVLGMPAILAASAVELKDAVKAGSELEVFPTLIGIIVAAVSGIAAIKLLYWLMKKDWFKYFGYYCAAMGVFCIITTIVTSF